MRTIILNLLTSLFLTVFSGLMIAVLFGIPAWLTVLILFAASFVPMPQGVLRDGLNQEIWIDKLLDNFYPKNDFLTEFEDQSEFVEFDAINLAEIGADPNVVRNRSVYPIPISQRTDAAIRKVLDEYSSDSTLVQDAEAVELAYNKLESVVRQHRRSIQKKQGNFGAWSIGPDDETNEDTPVIRTTGAVKDGKKIIAKADFAELAKKFSQKDYPKEGRRVLLPPKMFWDFLDSDETLKRQAEFNAQIGDIPGTFVNVYGFRVMERTNMPKYDFDAGADAFSKVAFGGVAANDERDAAIAYITSMVFRAQGTLKMYDKVDDPDYQGTILNFRSRFFASPYREKGYGAIVEAT